MDIRLHNTLSREKQVFSPQNPQRVTMYVCGPTVWSYAHIGNARPPVAFDVLFRLLRAKYGEDHVVYAANITDVDDKIIAAAAETGRPIAEITALYERIYKEDMGALGVIEPTHRPHATEHIGGMVEMIGTLVDKGHAYAGKDGVLFNVPSMPDYGKLSGRNRDEMVAGARVEVDAGKKDPADFALWKAAKPGEPPEARWPSPWGEGRPGWHIECSAMAKAVLGETIDIHAGGLDLIFPHHENEIAQSECAHGKPMARYWLHNGFLSMDSEKMSKSLGNVKLIHDLLKHYDGETMRLALLSAHYRQPLDWTEALLTQSKATLDRLYNALRRMDVEADDVPAPKGVMAALCDDLNTPLALAELSALATEANKAEAPEWPKLKGQILAAGRLLGLLQKDPEDWARGDGGQEELIDVYLAKRNAAKATQQFIVADFFRNVLSANGVSVMDTSTTSKWQRSTPKLILDLGAGSSGLIPSRRFLPAFAREVHDQFDGGWAAWNYDTTLEAALNGISRSSTAYLKLLDADVRRSSPHAEGNDEAADRLVYSVRHAASAAFQHAKAVKLMRRTLRKMLLSRPTSGAFVVDRKLRNRIGRLQAAVRLFGRTMDSIDNRVGVFRSYGQIGESIVVLHGLWTLASDNRYSEDMIGKQGVVVAVPDFLWTIALYVLAASLEIAQKLEQLGVELSPTVDDVDDASLRAACLLLELPNFSFSGAGAFAQDFVQLIVSKKMRSVREKAVIGSYFNKWPLSAVGSYPLTHVDPEPSGAVSTVFPNRVILRTF